MNEQSSTLLAQQLKQVFLDCLHELEPQALCDKHLRVGAESIEWLRASFDLDQEYPITRFPLNGSPLHCYFIGKAAMTMAAGVGEKLREAQHTFDGMVVAPQERLGDASHTRLKELNYLAGGHPIPNEGSQHAAELILQSLSKHPATDQVLFFVSGGGSALVEKTNDPSIPITELQHFYHLLVHSSLDIQQINSARCLLSATKAGQLRLAARQCEALSWIISDLPHAQPNLVASAPTIASPLDQEQSLQDLHRHGIWSQLSERLRTCLSLGARLPDGTDDCFSSARHQVRFLLDENDLLEQAMQLCTAYGWNCTLIPTVEGLDSKSLAGQMLQQARSMQKSAPNQTHCVISGGEVLSPVDQLPKEATGGRNQHFLLELLLLGKGMDFVAMSAGTDGIDGNSPAAGALIHAQSLGNAKQLKLEPEIMLRKFSSGNFFEALHDQIITGPTGQNLRDLRILLLPAQTS